MSYPWIQGTESIFLVSALSPVLRAILPKKLFLYTDLLPRLTHQQASSSKPVRMLSPKDGRLQVCVKPFNYSEDDVSFSLTNRDFKVYTYNREQEQAGKSLSMSLPKWVIDNTFKALEQVRRLEKELNSDLDNIYAKLYSVKSKD